MEVIPIANESPAGPPQEVKPAPIEASPLGRQSLGVETLEDRVLLTTEAAPAAVPADVELPQSPAAYVAQQLPPHAQPLLGDALAAASDAPDASDGGSTAAAEAPGGVNQNSKSGGLPGPSSEPRAEIVERAGEFKEKDMVEPQLEDKAERRFDENDSAGATIEPEGARSPRDREAAQRLLGSAPSDKGRAEDAPTDDAPSDGADLSDTEPTELESPEIAAAKASVIVSLTSQREQVMDNLGLNPVVDQLADKLALEAANLGPGASQATSAIQAEQGVAAGINAGDDSGDAASRQDATGHAADAADADPAGDAVAAYASQPATAFDRAADAARFNPAGDIDGGMPAAHDAVFARGQTMAERLPA